MKFDFNAPVNRRGTRSVKHDFASRYGMGYNALPLWIADMDFRVPPAVTRVITERAEHGVFGYSGTDEDYFTAVRQWFETRHSWGVEPHWLVVTEGILPAVSTAISVLTKPGDSVLLQTPAYNQFNMLLDYGKRKLVKNPLVLEHEYYVIDFDDFERKIVRENVKLFILCSPHNPTGRVWTLEELTRLGDICLAHGVAIISDEIFADFVFPGNVHTVFASIKPEYAAKTITCTAPTKTFNMSGVPISNIFIENDDLRFEFSDEYRSRGHLGTSVLPILACEAAYREGAEWLDDLLVYLRGNVDFAKGFIAERLPEIKWTEPEGTYLLWLDFRSAGFWAKELDAFIADEAQVLLSSESGAEGFLRINIACQRATLERALTQIELAFSKHRT